MDYCLGDGAGTATMWTGEPDLDLDGDGRPDAIGVDFDGDGLRDDALADLDGDGIADHLVLDYAGADASAMRFTDDGSGSWAMLADQGGSGGGGPLRWVGLDGAEHTGGPLVDFDGDGRAGDLLLDTNGDGLADRVLLGGGDAPGRYDTAYVDTDGDGRWDVKLTDADGDGAADGAAMLR
ncbi:MAG TPA: pullulanase [Mycobacterium sp.]|nr:pullulanase [Mycobacterium sp.]